jgi:hypothetical protein
MPTRKQRRRREKDFRHDVRVFEIDEEGNEIPIAELRTQDDRTAKPKPKAPQKGGGRPGRTPREVSPPTWDRALRRGGMMGGVMVLVFLFFLKTGPVAERLGIALVYGVAFVPLTYWIDRTAYRSFLKRSGRADAATGKKR